MKKLFLLVLSLFTFNIKCGPIQIRTADRIITIDSETTSFIPYFNTCLKEPFKKNENIDLSNFNSKQIITVINFINKIKPTINLENRDQNAKQNAHYYTNILSKINLDNLPIEPDIKPNSNLERLSKLIGLLEIADYLLLPELIEACCIKISQELQNSFWYENLGTTSKLNTEILNYLKPNLKLNKENKYLFKRPLLTKRLYLINTYSTKIKLLFWKNTKNLCGHTNTINYINFNHDGSLIASASRDNTIKIWDVKTGECIQTLSGHTNEVQSVNFNHDSSLIVSTSSDKTIKIWNIETGTCVKNLSEHTNTVNSARFNHDESLIVSASDDKTIKIWNVETGICVKNLSGHKEWVLAANFNHDSSLIISASLDGIIKIWDAITVNCLQTFSENAEYCHTINFNHDNSLMVAAYHNNIIKIYDLKNITYIQNLPGHEKGTQSVRFNQNGSLIASTSWDNTIKIWDVKTGNCIQTLYGHTDWVQSACFNFDNSLIASASKDKTIKIWEFISLKDISDHADDKMEELTE